MKTKVLLASLAMALSATGAWAELPTDGEYLIQNVETGYYLGGSNYWGTQACLINKPQWFALTSMSDGVYSLNSYQYNSETYHYLGSGLYVDQVETGWTFAENGENITISLNGAYLAGNGKNSGVTTVTEGTAAAAQWRLITKEEIVASQEDASFENPVDVTAFIRDPELKRNANTSFFPTWTITGADGTGSPSNFAQGSGGAIASCAESYHSTNGFKASQEITGLKPGYYAVSAQGFYREDGSQTVLPYLFANDKTATLPLRTGTENSMADAYASFLKESYPVGPVYVKIAEGETLTIGFRGEATDKWNIFGELALSYLGPQSPSEKLYVAALEAAKAVDQSQTMGVSDLQNLQDALAQYGNLTNVEDEEFDAATDTLNNVTSAAKASIKFYADSTYPTILAAMGEMVASTNFYTQEAVDAYYNNPQKAYKERTMTAAEAATLENPYAIRGWHAANTVDDLMLSVWGTKDYDSSLYINTWSTEGDTDGSNFVVPFFEYWTGGSSLGAQTWTATLDGLNPGTIYQVSALVRLQQKNKQTPVGVSLKVGESQNSVAGAPVKITGELIDGTDRFLNEYVATGMSDSNGTLKVSFIVAEGNNVSWLAFKNLVYSEYEITDEDLSKMYDEALQNAQDAKALADTKKMDKDVLQVLTSTLEEYGTKPETAASILTAVDALTAAVDTVNVNVKKIDEYEAALADAQAVADKADAADHVNAQLVKSLKLVVKAYSTQPAALENLQKAIDALDAAAESVEKNLTAYASAAEILPAMKEFTESTNFYSQEAYDEYYTEILEAYENGTLTTADAEELQNPNAKVNWHWSNRVDDLLLSLWDSEPEIWTDYHVNTWSEEGDGDGSNFLVPFIEYWTGDALTLEARALTATVTGLDPKAEYIVSLNVRVKRTDGNTEDPYGITFQVGDGDPVDVCTGAQIGDTPRFLQAVTASGNSDADGVLTVKFIVAADNNISWLSFRDVNYEASIPVGISSAKSEDASSLSIYDLSGRKQSTLKKGINIVDGKKILVK